MKVGSKYKIHGGILSGMQVVTINFYKVPLWTALILSWAPTEKVNIFLARNELLFSPVSKIPVQSMSFPRKIVSLANAVPEEIACAVSLYPGHLIRYKTSAAQ